MTIVDSEARLQAIDPTGSFVVQAPAGSGKTTLLIQRYLALLARVETPEEVVALTFTRKAADEMRTRVLDALVAVDEGSPGAGEGPAATTRIVAERAARHAQACGWRLETCPSRLRIQTFDALCADLVKQWPAAAGAGVAFEVTDAPKALYAEAALATFEHLGQDSEIGHAVADLLPALQNDINKFLTLVSELLGRREQWLPIVLGSVGPDPVESRRVLEAAFLTQGLNTLERVRRACPDGILIQACSYLEAATGDSSWHSAALGGHDAQTLSRWQELATRLLTVKGDFRKRLSGWPPELGPVATFCAELETLPELAEALRQLRGWGPCVYSEDQWQRLAALVRILPQASAELLLVFARRQTWDFTEVALRALQTLGSGDEPGDGALRLDHCLRHILVDEFQDTSVLQYRLLERLTAEWVQGEDRSLFVVGDPMQSIYSFRKAEVSLFLRVVQEGLAGWPLKALTLTANFRSQDRLVDWVNACFGAILPARSDPQEGAVPHVAATAVKGPGGTLHVHALDDVDLAAEAQYVADLVGRIRAEDTGSRIAILVRSRAHGHAIAEVLRKAGLRFSAVDLYSLAGRAVISDLLALTETLVWPGARLSVLSCLRAPWCGLDVADLSALCEGDDRDVRELLEDEARLVLLSAEGRLRALRFRQVWTASCVTRAQGPLVARVEAAWIALGGPAVLDTESELEEAELFFQVLAELERAAEVSLWGLRERLESLYAPPDPNADDLQILTIHKAKGLEFDIVICPGLGRDTATDHRPLLLALEAPGPRGPDLLLAPLKADGEDTDALYESLWASLTRKRRHEWGRLLYVACTRARASLHLVGHSARKEGIARPRGLLRVLWPVIEAAFESPRLCAPGSQSTPEAVARPARRLPQAAWSERDLVPAVGWDPVLVVPEGPVVFDWAGSCIRTVGIVVHKLLAELTHHSLPPPGVVPDALKARAESLLRAYGLQGSDWDEAHHHVLEALRLTLIDPEGRWLLGPHGEAASECALSALGEDRVTTVRVDRTFVDTDGVRWIIDYKTSRHEGSDNVAFLDQEQGRYREQLTNYARFFTALDPRPVELALYFPLLSALRHWRYEGP